MTVAAKQWTTEFKEINDSNEELNAHGKFFTCSYLLDMETTKVLIQTHAGKIVNVTMDPGPLEHYQFAIRASADTWRKFSQPTPPPMYHGIWAASFQRDMKLEGDLLVLMQNLRCLTTQLELLRVVGVPV
ncbi:MULTISPECIES: hypothetical protein [Paenibacillus]|uniref:Uncharacterized protein n=1 Tax=Paenibacillus naphthalenovorans TaxID=162209 RepID=A0A0U2KZQ0_9BACL|nr:MULTISPECIES: hypothetical protein [Paenibacillus]ALS22578.1 hypothetical protein IJ22_22040 [Paenibacillus naphthalenovorans]GCL70373.1 hypothetical protein PN4B1_02730 [Paenibacillus naphthalenovorans]SDH84420.1 hypothetical protein SAMN05421868_101298 [Paenibacillus naphthalenovorans]